MVDSNKITVVTVCDNHYIVLLAALIKSIEAHLHDGYALDMWVIDDDLTNINREKLERSIDGRITQLHWKKAREAVPSGTSLPLDYQSWPMNIYLRLFIPEFMPEDISKAIFLDVDIINCRDLSELWRTDLQGNIAGAVTDSRIKTFDNSWGGVKNYGELGIPGSTRYFNSGLLLIDVNKWKAFDTAKKTLNCVASNKAFANYPDQYGLNIVLRDQWLELDPGWNHFASKAMEPAYNIHFVQRKPIYKSYNNHPEYQNMFYEYLNRTEWRGLKPIGESRRYLKKLSNIFEKVKEMINR